jgi:hypothetical protein
VTDPIWEAIRRANEEAAQWQAYYRTTQPPARLAPRGPDGVWIITDCEPYTGGYWTRRLLSEALSTGYPQGVDNLAIDERRSRSVHNLSTGLSPAALPL